MAPGISWYVVHTHSIQEGLPICVSWYQSVCHSTNLCVMVPICVSWYQSVCHGTNLCVMVPICCHGINLYVMVPICVSWYQSVCHGINLYVMVPICMSWYQSVCHGIIRSPGRTLVYQARLFRRVGDGLALNKHMQTRLNLIAKLRTRQNLQPCSVVSQSLLAV